MSKVIKVTVDFVIEDEVYLRTDPEQRKFIVTAINLGPKDVTYKISYNTETYDVYGFEISDTRDIALATSN